jgi:putative ABC transport system ATP-binding protein
MQKDFLRVNNLGRIYNQDSASEVIALKDVSFSLEKGSFTMIIGSNAAGKTTLFDLLAGAQEPSSGEILLDGKTITAIPEFKRARFVARVRQNPNDSVVLSLTVAENLALAQTRSKRAGLGRAITKKFLKECVALLEPLGVGLETRLHEPVAPLSGGQKQALALVMVTLSKPELLLLDEHTAALDPHVSKKVLLITERLVRESGITTLMVTHNIHQALSYGERLLMLERGRITYDVTGNIKKALTMAEVIGRLERA